MEAVTIKSSSSGNTLRLSNPKPPGYRYPVESISVELRGRERVASSLQIYLYDPYDPVDFFEDLARHWKSCEGEKRGCSIEDDFILSVTSDSVGHVGLAVTLESGPYDEDWKVRTAITIDAGHGRDQTTLTHRRRVLITLDGCSVYL
jgi:Family of unknown function (DUF6228)